MRALMLLALLAGCGTRQAGPECKQQFDDCTDACGPVCDSKGVPENNGTSERTNTWSMECNSCTERCRSAASRCESRAKTVVEDDAP